MPQAALVFDFDGVILDAVTLKHRAFATIFPEYPHHLAQIIAYNASQPGVPRLDKIRHVCTQILHCPDDAATVERFLQRYAAAIEQSAAHAPLVPGVRDFLAATTLPKFIASSAPLAEVAEMVQKHGIGHHFAGLFGYPDRKPQVLQRLQQQYQPLIFFGDAVADYTAAQSAGVAFIGVVNPDLPHRFADLPIPTIQQFTDPAAIQALLAALLA